MSFGARQDVTPLQVTFMQFAGPVVAQPKRNTNAIAKPARPRSFMPFTPCVGSRYGNKRVCATVSGRLEQGMEWLSWESGKFLSSGSPSDCMRYERSLGFWFILFCRAFLMLAMIAVGLWLVWSTAPTLKT